MEISWLRCSSLRRLSSMRWKQRSPAFWMASSSSKLKFLVMLFSHPSSSSISSTRRRLYFRRCFSLMLSYRSEDRNSWQFSFSSLNTDRTSSSMCRFSRDYYITQGCALQSAYYLMPKLVWLDCDPGHDDMLAIVMAALSEGLTLVGLSTSAGNSYIENTTQNALNILHEIGRDDVRVIRGAAAPLCRKLEVAPSIHGESGLEGATLLHSPRAAVQDKPFLHIYTALMGQPEKVEFVVTGAMTNLAILLRAFPDVKEKINGVTIMGGAIGPGNWSPAAEFNILVDPEAASIVFAEGLPITMIPLEVTHTVEATEEIFAEFATLTSSFGQKISPLFRYFQKMYKQDQDFTFPVAHDPTTIYYLLHPEDFKSRRALVEIEVEGKSRGRTNCHFMHRPPNATVCERINVPNFWKAMLDCLRKVK